ncbi:hypothetical protein [Chitinophaga sp. YR627]|uniref:hypothetical protein n=1 Tax=Chitinophaga sp. YR627 TaxID=1881041 RepID=UPI000B7C9CEE|nr:hypothetical protein [Chitinophaga sp. YR627]
MKVLLITCLVLLGVQKAAFCQSKCAHVYDQFDIMPVLPGLEKTMMQHSSRKIMPIISSMGGEDPECLLYSLRAKLLVDRQGKVTDVFFQTRMPDKLKEKLCDEFLQMKGFQPARYKGEPVCAMFYYMISCMNWQE